MCQLHCCLCRVRKLSDSIKDILICVPKINEGLTCLEWHECRYNDRISIFGWIIPVTILCFDKLVANVYDSTISIERFCTICLSPLRVKFSCRHSCYIFTKSLTFLYKSNLTNSDKFTSNLIILFSRWTVSIRIRQTSFVNQFNQSFENIQLKRMT